MYRRGRGLDHRLELDLHLERYGYLCYSTSKEVHWSRLYRKPMSDAISTEFTHIDLLSWRCSRCLSYILLRQRVSLVKKLVYSCISGTRLPKLLTPQAAW